MVDNAGPKAIMQVPERIILWPELMSEGKGTNLEKLLRCGFILSKIFPSEWSPFAPIICIIELGILIRTLVAALVL